MRVEGAFEDVRDLMEDVSLNRRAGHQRRYANRESTNDPQNSSNSSNKEYFILWISDLRGASRLVSCRSDD